MEAWDGVLWINCIEEHGRECAVFVKRCAQARKVAIGDTIWWQDKAAMWTPLDRRVINYQLEKIGCSGVPRPSQSVEARNFIGRLRP